MGQERIEVKVIPFADRPALQLQWYCPQTGLRKTRSAKTADPDEAERARADLEYELSHGLHASSVRTGWARFRELFEDEYLPGVRPRTAKQFGVVLDHFERICRPVTMEGVSARTLSQFLAGLRQVPGRGPAGRNGMQPSTLAVRLEYLRSALSWAQRQGMLTAVPSFPEVKLPKRRPQPVATDLFERLFLAAQTPELRAYLACGWLDGLRLGEAQQLRWESSDEAPWLDLARDRIWLPAAAVKGVEDQWLPLAPELRQLLAGLPRKGPHVFPWHDYSQGGMSNVIRRLAARADVPLTMRSLRRGFGCRYAGIVPAQTLQRLMRHADIRTTLGYYVSLDQAAEDAVLRNTSATPGLPKPSNP
jgi:integrase